MQPSQEKWTRESMEGKQMKLDEQRLKCHQNYKSRLKCLKGGQATLMVNVVQ